MKTEETLNPEVIGWNIWSTVVIRALLRKEVKEQDWDSVASYLNRA